jgi:endonuclease YncB( thermonuclease family)
MNAMRYFRFAMSSLAVASVMFFQDAHSADLIHLDQMPGGANLTQDNLPVFSGRVSVIDGRTLWFPQFAQKVRLLDIDACELPQWAINPIWDRERSKAPLPVPCGPLAKAWLKRTIGASSVSCQTVEFTRDGLPVARCTAGGRDIALDMLKVGWARVSSPAADRQYVSYQRTAMAARYGMWATYVLDMNEWRRRAIDRTLQRQPIADYNLLVTRKSEISPPFEDLRHKPKRTDQ